MPEITLPEVELNIYSPKDPIEAKVVENYIVTKESSPNYVRHITFDVSGTDLEGRVRVGQSIGVLPPGKDERGKPHKLRLYSVSSPTKGEKGKQHLISTTVKRSIDEINDHKIYLGIASNYLADLSPGDPVKLTGPSGRRFLLPENAAEFNYLFFATGTGIAPFRGMIMELFEDKDFNNDVVLNFGCPYRTDYLYYDYFTKMAEEQENFHYLTCVSREERRKDGSKNYVQSVLEDHEDLLGPLLKKDNTLIYICGLKGMQVSIYHKLAKLGYREYLVIREPLIDMDPAEWKYEDIKRKVKPADRTFEEVY